MSRVDGAKASERMKPKEVWRHCVIPGEPGLWATILYEVGNFENKPTVLRQNRALITAWEVSVVADEDTDGKRHGHAWCYQEPIFATGDWNRPDAERLVLVQSPDGQYHDVTGFLGIIMEPDATLEDFKHRFLAQCRGNERIRREQRERE